MRKILLPIILLLSSLGLHAQTTTVTGNLKTVLGENLGSNTFIRIRLRNYKPNRPLVSGVGIIGQTTKDVSPDSNGLINTTVYDNDFITPDGTFYTLEFYLQSRFVFAASYEITGASFDFNTATPLSSVPMAAVPVAESRVFTHIQATPATTWTIIHNFAVREVTLDFYDASFNRIFPDLVTLTDINTVTALFVVAQSGRAVVMRAENVNLTTSISDPVLKVPTTSQSISGGFDLTLDGNFLLAQTGQNIGSPTVRPDAFLETVTTGILNNILWLDGNKYACSSAGIISAIGDIPSTGGIVDARGCEGDSLTFATNPFASVTKPIFLLLGAGIWSTDVVLDMSTMQDSGIIGLPVGGASSLDAATIIKASGSFPATSAIIDWSPASVTEARMTFTDLFLDADDIAQDCVLIDNFITIRMRRLTCVDALRDGFRFESSAGTSFNAQLEELYSNGADSASYRIQASQVTCHRCISDLGSSGATAAVVEAPAGTRAKITEGIFAGGSIGILVNGGGGRSYFAGNRIGPNSNTTKTVCFEVANVSSGILNRFIGNQCTGNLSATTSIGINLLGASAGNQIIVGNRIDTVDTGIVVSGNENTISGNNIEADQEGVTIASSNNSVWGGRINVLTGSNAINVTSGTGNVTGGVTTPDLIVGAISQFGRALVVNEDGADVDSRIEGDTDENLFYVDAGSDQVGIGDPTPTFKLDVAGTFRATGNSQVDGSWKYADALTLAASTTPSVVGGNVFLTNSTASITDFTGELNGQVIILLCEADTTTSLVDSTPLFLNAGFTCTADDTITLVSNGTVWYETSRSVN